MKLIQMLNKFHKEESGQDLLEYALVLAAVLAAVVTGSGSLATTITNSLSTLNGKISTSISQVS
jgi:Flp pilus assembly pilin Flp